jgi:hypothetical protein
MVKPFNDFVFNSSIGSIGLVETPPIFHIIVELTVVKTFTQDYFEIEATEKILMLWQRDGTYSCSWN